MQSMLDIIWVHKNYTAEIPGPGREVLTVGFGRGMPPWNLKVDPYKYQFVKEKVTPFIYQSALFLPKFWAKIPDFSNESILAKIYEHFAKSTHSYTNFCVLREVIHIPRDWSCYPCWRHIPVGSFVLSTPPPLRLKCSLKVLLKGFSQDW